MDNVTVIPAERIGLDFISDEFIPEGKDEYYLRNQQQSRPLSSWRHLNAQEIEELVKNGNSCDNWNRFLVTDKFDPTLIINCEFFGLVRVGRLQQCVLQHHDLRVPVGITNSCIISCDIGDDSAVHHVRYLAHYIVGTRCIMLNIDEMHTSNHAKFGNGIIKQGEEESVRIWLELMNEKGTRSVMPFDTMIPADAYLWAKYRDDTELQHKLKEITQSSYDDRRGFYGEVGDQAVIKSCRIIKDSKIGPHCYIKGANKLKNLTIKSSEEEPTQIGEGVELVNGIIGFGCHVFYGCKAVRFILCSNSNLKYGARLLNSLLGPNSTVSCCEMLNNLIFPAHEQHHNNSFLVASLVMGQSNIAAGATVGSNHNSRANDNEIQAGRGFWAGLCTSLRHSSRFASYTLLVKGDYPAEMDISLPFSLVSNNIAGDSLEVMPAFWWTRNMYALARNSWKFRDRDKRKDPAQNIEFDFLAPDTAEEIITGRTLLEEWSGNDLSDDRELAGRRMEKSKRKPVILKAAEGYRAYGDMLHYYGVTNCMEWLEAHPKASLADMAAKLSGEREQLWVNMGGQIMPASALDGLRADIRGGQLRSWEEIHAAYDRIWKEYPLVKQRHAYAVLCLLLNIPKIEKKEWRPAVERCVEIQDFICEQVYLSRKKDFDNPFRRMTYRSDQEMTAAIGSIENDSFVRKAREDAETFRKRAATLGKR